MSKKTLGIINPNSLSVFNQPSIELQYNPLQEVDAYISSLPETIPKLEADFLKSFITKGTIVNTRAFGQTYINEDRTNVMKEISLQKRYDRLLSYSEAKINSIIIGELKSEIEYYHAISSLCDNVCKFLGYYYDNSSKNIYILMENCGTDLFDIYAQNEGPSLEQSTYFIKQIVEALVCLHTHGFAHRDLKPENITVTPEGKILLIDFGFLTKNGDTNVPRKGTPLYMSPENFKVKLLSFEELMASDIYSLGVIIMFMFLKDYKFLFNTMKNSKYDNSNFTMRIDMLDQKGYGTKVAEINKECQANLTRVFGDSISMDSFFEDNPKKRTSAVELNDLLESPTESSRTFSLGGSKSRKKKRGARRHQATPSTSRRGGNRRRSLIERRTQKTNKSRRRRRR